MLTRRDFMQVAAATAVMTARPGSLGAATAKLTQEDLLSFDSTGQVTLLNFTDCHAQLVPLYFREPSVNLGVGEANGLPPHLTGKDFLKHFELKGGSKAAYALTSDDFNNLARQWGRIGGMDRMATLVKAIRAERPSNTLLLDGGDTWQGSYTSLKTRGADMVKVMNALGVEAMTGHWEFTYGAERVEELIATLDFPFLAGNVTDKTWDEDIFEHTKMFERGGVKIAVIGQAFPYTPIANPRYMMPDWSFGIQEEKVQERVDAARAAGAELIVLNSHNGFDVDRKMASRVTGIDVILTGHTHDAIPTAIKVSNTLLIASGSHGKFLARLDLKVENKKVVDYRFKLIPVFSDVITPDPEMATLIKEIRAPHAAEIDRVLGRTDSLLYRRGNLNGTFDDLICDALLTERDSQIALSPGFRWGATLLPGDDITADTLYSQTAITYPNVYRNEMTGAFLKEILEDVADNLFNPDPYLQQGGDMVRVGGMGYAIDIGQPIGKRISDMTLLASGEKIDPAKTYIVSGWASVNEGTEGPPVYDLVSKYITDRKVIRLEPNRSIKVRGI
ncbi:MAG: thiosulfohydrolase SoxB [Alphaproteobacteria bacterium]|jgi:S-sulfosulfanyl-L-cysteine sulfohydrolase|nr:thiosulfohydrolase SoxB [Alphaproteobacteria bacterium]MBT4020050.1 thiosulfohydrolase SoxB [Alphaproteobacteria bacterium]MBT5161892.1 thiosulfohydrolase SoxB [Alphaproteobacteria bacterium]MBT7744124.1 thiosulfohydrolase SoxB [Alphaproteobacteria bacterium]